MDGVTKTRIQKMLPLLNEKQRRMYLATEVESIGYGGLQAVHELTGMSKTTIIKGKKDLQQNNPPKETRIRKTGGGRKPITQKHQTLKTQIEKILENNTAGNPEKTLLWTTKSLRNIAQTLKTQGITVSHDTIGNVLKDMGYSLQQNQKMLQTGQAHPDRNQQFEHINQTVNEFLSQSQPVISVDTKKKELIENFKNNGAEYHKSKDPHKVLDHDFPIKELDKVAPYGVYDIARNEGFVNLGLSHDTSEFAVASILRWWQTLGVNTYPNASKIYITSDNGGSNGSRLRLWKKQLQEFANISGLSVVVSHFPPGTSKWNKIEHKMFCYISKNWRGVPLISVETVIALISNTTTFKGLRIVCIRDNRCYALGTKVSDEEIAQLNLERNKFHGDWNYTIHPK
ncbi:MAG: ISAzo13 family transposase [Candidatus Bathyarchaeota archaeon]|uniref:ISAzo13 family transposase n=3 Tax=Candidatus Bathycorpusculum sp. TaxID=2994959 RepID=UPI002828E3EB|nr:ISAzo13 family transposase [Candidatus Termiticorpusculum sp.]MCL2292112.1 ISAzo13 family transposase [Candidatus Termiticorpusculum sp.]